MKIDTLIVGQGLAGSLIAWQMLQRGQRILVVDRDEAVTSSKVAAGLVTPLTGSRFSLPEGLPERLLFAQRFYFEAEEATGSRFFHHKKVVRLFRNEKERATWETQKGKESLAEFHAPLEIDSDTVHAPHGGFEMQGGGWLDVPTFLESTRQHLLERAAYAIARVDSEDIKPGPEGVDWKNIQADRVIFAEGWRGNQNRFFDWLPMHPAVGDILELKIPTLEGESRILNRGGWLLPLANGVFRAGSTYRHDFENESPTAEGREMVLEKLSHLTPSSFEVTNHLSAARPIIHRSQVFAGIHPGHRAVAFFNGLGSKGVLNGPWYADRLAAHLMDDEPLPPGCDIRSNFL